MSDTARLRQRHKKSRNGCQECKRRHIKCDESRPACGACLATNRRCSFLGLQPVPPPSYALATPSASPSGTLSASQHSPLSAFSSPAADLASSREITVPPVDSDAISPPSDQQPTSCFDTRHLVLLHHLEWAVVGPSNPMMSADATEDKACYEAIFKAAVSAPYLMHELLAFSALHLSTLQPDGVEKAEYTRQAAELQARALALFNAVQPEVRSENCMALFIFSSIIGLHTLFDAVASCTDFTGLLDQITNYLRVHRGVGAITNQSWDVLRHSEMRHIFDSIETGEQARAALESSGNPCDKLVSLVHASSDKMGAGPYRACQEAVHALHLVFGLHGTLPKPYPTHIIIAWPIRIPSEFIELLEQRQPIPLVILAHWAVLLHAERDFWVFGNAGRHTINSLLTYLGSYWDEWLDLPRDVLNNE